jgi:hypothetical protein
MKKQMNKTIQNISGVMNTSPSIPNDGSSKIYNSRLNPFSDQKPVRQRQGGITNIFPIKLFSMLQTLALNESCSDIVKWSENGDAFIILKPKEFTKFLLPIYFRTTKLSSFQRQLNAYGFAKFNLYACQEDFHVYYHKFFHRDHPDRVNLVCRRNVLESSDVSDCKREQKNCYVGKSKRRYLSCRTKKKFQDITSYPYKLTKNGEIHPILLTLASVRAERSQGCTLRDLVLDQAAEEVWDKDANSSREMAALFEKWNPKSEVLNYDVDDLARVVSDSIQHSKELKISVNPNLGAQESMTTEDCSTLQGRNTDARVKVRNTIASPEKDCIDAGDDNLEEKFISSDDWDHIFGISLKDWEESHEDSELAVSQDYFDLASGDDAFADENFEVTWSQGSHQTM